MINSIFNLVKVGDTLAVPVAKSNYLLGKPVTNGSPGFGFGTVNAVASKETAPHVVAHKVAATVVATPVKAPAKPNKKTGYETEPTVAPQPSRKPAVKTKVAKSKLW